MLNLTKYLMTVVMAAFLILNKYLPFFIHVAHITAQEATHFLGVD